MEYDVNIVIADLFMYKIRQYMVLHLLVKYTGQDTPLNSSWTITKAIPIRVILLEMKEENNDIVTTFWLNLWIQRNVLLTVI